MPLLKQLQGKKVMSQVTKYVSDAKKEIIATMLLSEELNKPLPESYHKLLGKKTIKGVRLKRLGFGTKEEYNQIKKRYIFKKNYSFFLCNLVENYQRLIIIDRETLFFEVNGHFFTSTYKPLVQVFVGYFNQNK